MVVVDGKGVPLGDYLHSASRAEVGLVEKTLASIRVRRRHQAGRPRQKPERMIGDRGYDSDPLRKQLARRGIELIAPHRNNRRWIIERTIAWLGNFRRLAVRYDRSLTVYRGFFHIACFMINCGISHPPKSFTHFENYPAVEKWSQSSIMPGPLRLRSPNDNDSK